MFYPSKKFVVSWLGINIHNTCLHTKIIKIAFKFCYCSNKDRESTTQIQGKTQNSRKNQNSRKKLRTQGKNLNFSAFSESCDVKKMAKKDLYY